METVTAIGTIAGTLTTVALFPQAYRIWRLRSADDVSAATYVTMSLGIGIWALYGALIRSTPVVVFNVISLVFSLGILILKIHYRNR
jgi:MtN3 and saliva related transmembrane protein